MMKHTEPVEGLAPGHPTPHETRACRRQRQEHELRQQWLRRQLQGVEPVRDADAPLGPAPTAAAIEPPIGADTLPPPVPIGQPSPTAAVASAVSTAGTAASDLLLEEGGPADERIIGSGDRMHHLALVAGRAPPAPPWPRARTADALVLPPGPKSRAECRRRCGKAGFCDPSSALGCGGEYCGNASAAARNAL